MNSLKHRHSSTLTQRHYLHSFLSNAGTTNPTSPGLGFCERSNTRREPPSCQRDSTLCVSPSCSFTVPTSESWSTKADWWANRVQPDQLTDQREMCWSVNLFVVLHMFFDTCALHWKQKLKGLVVPSLLPQSLFPPNPTQMFLFIASWHPVWKHLNSGSHHGVQYNVCTHKQTHTLKWLRRKKNTFYWRNANNTS